MESLHSSILVKKSEMRKALLYGLSAGAPDNPTPGGRAISSRKY